MSRNKLKKLIDVYQAHVNDEVRNYIGASAIGHDCWRKIWYELHGVKGESVEPKVRRTWDIGKALEKQIVAWLINAGAKVYTLDKTFHANECKLFQGHVDGVIVFGRKKSILEIKTAKDASFKIFIKNGLKVWNPQYYAQIQSYMGMSGVNSAYILVLNKDNSDISDEYIVFDEEFYNSLVAKASMIERAVLEPPKVNGSPCWYQCKMCKFHKVCHK